MMPSKCAHCLKNQPDTRCSKCKGSICLPCVRYGCPVNTSGEPVDPNFDFKRSVAPKPGPLPFPIPGEPGPQGASKVPGAAEPVGAGEIGHPGLALIGTIIRYPNGVSVMVAGINDEGHVIIFPLDTRPWYVRFWHWIHRYDQRRQD